MSKSIKKFDGQFSGWVEDTIFEQKKSKEAFLHSLQSSLQKELF